MSSTAVRASLGRQVFSKTSYVCPVHTISKRQSTCASYRRTILSSLDSRRRGTGTKNGSRLLDTPTTNVLCCRYLLCLTNDPEPSKPIVEVRTTPVSGCSCCDKGDARSWPPDPRVTCCLLALPQLSIYCKITLTILYPLELCFVLIKSHRELQVLPEIRHSARPPPLS